MDSGVHNANYFRFLTYSQCLRLEAIEAGLKTASDESEKRSTESEQTVVAALDKMKEEMRDKFGDVTSKVMMVNRDDDDDNNNDDLSGGLAQRQSEGVRGWGTREIQEGGG